MNEWMNVFWNPIFYSKADETEKLTYISNFFYNKVYSFTFLGILDKGDFYFLTPFMKIAFFLGREYAL